MTTLADRLRLHTDECSGLAASHPSLPPMFAVRLHDESHETKVQLPSLSRSENVRISFGPDGSLIGTSKIPRGICFFGRSIATLRVDGELSSFGLSVHGESYSSRYQDDWKSWSHFATKIAPILWAYPETGVAKLTHPSSAVMAFVFCCVYGTEFIAPYEQCFVLQNLWGATLYALRQDLGPFPDGQAMPTRKGHSPRGVTSKQVNRRGNPGIGDEAELRREILARVATFHSQREAAEELFGTYRPRILAICRLSTTMDTVDEFYNYISKCKDWQRKQPAKPEQMKRKKS